MAFESKPRAAGDKGLDVTLGWAPIELLPASPIAPNAAKPPIALRLDTSFCTFYSLPRKRKPELLVLAPLDRSDQARRAENEQVIDVIVLVKDGDPESVYERIEVLA